MYENINLAEYTHAGNQNWLLMAHMVLRHRTTEITMSCSLWGWELELLLL